MSAAALVAAAREICGPDSRTAIRSLTDAIAAIAKTCPRPEIELSIAAGALQVERRNHIAELAVVRPFTAETSDDIDTAPMRRVERED